MQLAALILLCTILCAASCKKEEKGPQLPPETHTGAYTFGCKVDGKIYTAKGQGGLLATQKVAYSYISSDSTFYLYAVNAIDNKFSISLQFKCFELNKNCILSQFPNQGIFQDDSNGTLPGTNNIYKTTTTSTGFVKIKYFDGTFSPGNFGTYVSGTFEMDAVNGNGKIIHITEGRFDAGR